LVRQEPETCLFSVTYRSIKIILSIRYDTRVLSEGREGMSLASGQQFGIYAIAEVIGEGGMGQVYRATDTTLDRDVAIKVLPESFASDAERVSRFDREAKTLASLNHTNIAQNMAWWRLTRSS